MIDFSSSCDCGCAGRHTPQQVEDKMIPLIVYRGRSLNRDPRRKTRWLLTIVARSCIAVSGVRWHSAPQAVSPRDSPSIFTSLSCASQSISTLSFDRSVWLASCACDCRQSHMVSAHICSRSWRKRRAATTVLATGLCTHAPSISKQAACQLIG